MEDIYRHYDDSRRSSSEEVPVPIGVPEVRLPAGLSYGSELAHLHHPFGSYPQRGYHFGKVIIEQTIFLITLGGHSLSAGLNKLLNPLKKSPISFLIIVFQNK